MRRAAVSIPSNIAAGIGRNYTKDTLQFIYIARGSMNELETQLIIINELYEINEVEFDRIWTKLQNCKMLINGFINYFKNKK